MRSVFAAVALLGFGALAQPVDPFNPKFRNVTIGNSLSVGNDVTVGDDLTVTDTTATVRANVLALDAGSGLFNDSVRSPVGKFDALDAGFAFVAGNFGVGGNITALGNTNLGGINVQGASANVLRNSTTASINMQAAGNLEIAPVSGNLTRFVSSAIQVDTNINLAGPVLTDTSTDPTVSFCSGAALTAPNGSAAFQLDVGTACAASTGTITLPTATTGWVCHCETSVADRIVQQKAASSTTVVTMTNATISTGAASNYTDGQDLFCTCRAY